MLSITNLQQNANKTTMKYHLTSVRMAITKKKIASADEVVEKKEPLCTVGGNVNWFIHYGKQYGTTSRN